MQSKRGGEQWLMEEGGCLPVDHSLLPKMAVILFKENVELV
jgi:hypothetical protein